jgi:hypothetical protein
MARMNVDWNDVNVALSQFFTRTENGAGYGHERVGVADTGDKEIDDVTEIDPVIDGLTLMEAVMDRLPVADAVVDTLPVTEIDPVADDVNDGDTDGVTVAVMVGVGKGDEDVTETDPLTTPTL